jgi:hyaluronan synthase
VGRRAQFWTLIAVVAAGIVVLVRHVDRLEHSPIAGVTLFAAAWMTVRLLFAASARPVEVSPLIADGLAQRRVVAIVPFYNEDPRFFRECLDSFARQTRPPNVLWLLDDCSDSLRCVAEARRFARGDLPFEVRIFRADRNVGKRHAQAHAFANDHADIWVTCDSDTVLAPNAIEEGLKPFAYRDVSAVAGLTLGRNWNRNLLTRIVDIDFANSFLIGRASMSKVGSVLVACGTLAFYRSRVIEENLDDYVNETFLGYPVLAGDDRRLTQYSLLYGRVVFQETSVAYTALPERLGHLVRQRLRWSASFYRGAAWVAGNVRMSRAAYWLIVLQVVELVFVLLTLGAFAFHSVSVGLTALVAYMGYMTAISYIRCLRYLTFNREDMTFGDRARSVLIAPLIALLYTFILTPIRYFSVTRVRDKRWGTRSRVEVALT